MEVPGASPASEGDDLSGQWLRDGLRVDEAIARGSFGTVYRGYQVELNRAVAIKVLHARWGTSGEAALLFREEMRAIGAIDHRNVIRIHEAGALPDGRAYFVMELLAGATLLQLAERGPIRSERAIALIGQLLAGLAAVHAADRIHADVKPANAMITTDEVGERLVLIDFGLTRTQRDEGPTQAVGGTHAFMAPEQLAAWQLDARSDVFAAALVLVRLLTGWERSSVHEEIPPLDSIQDPTLRIALRRALARVPGDRPSARDFMLALAGGVPEVGAPSGPPSPFHPLVPLAGSTRTRLGGRELDIERIARSIEPRHVLVCVGPSGIGKTSLLRAGLVPYLHAAGIPIDYHNARERVPWTVPPASAPGHHRVLIIDQAEAALDDHDPQLASLLEPPLRADLAIVLVIREDLLARALSSHATLAGGAPVFRVRPLGRDGARVALTAPFEEHGVALESSLLATLLEDLVAAGERLGDDDGAVIYPPHIQLVGDALWRAHGNADRTLTLTHYRKLGGVDALLADDLERRIGELGDEERRVARAVLLALVGAAAGGAPLEERELVAQVGTIHGDLSVRRLLSRLEDQRLLVRRCLDQEASWELIHDSLIPRIEDWLSVQDLERRRVAELVRFHLRQSQPDAPALLSRSELRLTAGAPEVIDELEREWERRDEAVWTPRRLIRQSRIALRRRWMVTAITAAVAASAIAMATARWLEERALRSAELSRRDGDVGLFDLELAPFDWTVDAMSGKRVAVRVPVSELPDLSAQLHEVDLLDLDSPGSLVHPPVRHGVVERGGSVVVERGMEARGGPAFLVIGGRGRTAETCDPSIVRIERLPGYAQRRAGSTIHVDVPTCAASRYDTVEIPAGSFVQGGPGDPPASSYDELPPERETWLPTYSVDRTEVSNAAAEVFERGSSVHGTWLPPYPEQLAEAAGPNHPRTDIDWSEARAYCRYMGKHLPSFEQWQKALRGGLALPDGTNSFPRRAYPWGDPGAWHSVAVELAESAPVGSYPDDRSPYSVMDLAGNVSEWLSDDLSSDKDVRRRQRAIAGGNWSETKRDELRLYVADRNARSPRFRAYVLGFRCVLNIGGALGAQEISHR